MGDSPRSSRPPILRSLRTSSFALVVTVAALGGLVSACTSDNEAPSASQSPQTGTSVTGTSTATRTTSNTTVQGVIDFADVVEEVMPSVVLIESVNGGTGLGVSGSGVIVDEQGHILTNFHVVQGQQQLKVSLADGTASLAELIGTDPANDLAVIRATGFSSEDLRPADFGDSDEVRVGQPVFAIGSPFTQEFSVTSGIVSAIDRDSDSAFAQRRIYGVLQTDAALNPGNSGGPLFNLAGEVVGINTSIENPEGRVFAGIGFAVPANTATRFLPQMIAGEDIQHPQLGVATEDLDEVEATRLGTDVSRGLHVRTVVPGSAAERAGVRPGDVIVSVNGQATRGFVDLARAIDTAGVGGEVAIIVSRAGQEVALSATLQSWDVN